MGAKGLSFELERELCNCHLKGWESISCLERSLLYFIGDIQLSNITIRHVSSENLKRKERGIGEWAKGGNGKERKLKPVLSFGSHCEFLFSCLLFTVV